MADLTPYPTDPTQRLLYKIAAKQANDSVAGTPLLVDSAQTLQLAQQNRALANLWPSYDGSVAVFVTNGLELVDSPGGLYKTRLDAYGITTGDNPTGVAYSVNASVGFEAKNASNASVHNVSVGLIRFFGAAGITAPRPAASTTTLADVIALLKQLGFVANT